MRWYKINDSLSCEYFYQKHGSPDNPNEHHLLVIYGDDVGIGYYDGLRMVLHSTKIEKWYRMFFEHAVTFKHLFEKYVEEEVN